MTGYKDMTKAQLRDTGVALIEKIRAAGSEPAVTGWNRYAARHRGLLDAVETLHAQLDALHEPQPEPQPEPDSQPEPEPQLTTMLAEALRRERVRRHERQEDTAARFGISQPSYWRWEAGKGLPNDRFFAAVADFLGMTTEEVWQLAYGDEKPQSLSNLTEMISGLQRDIDDLRSRLAKVEALLAQLDALNEP